MTTEIVNSWKHNFKLLLLQIRCWLYKEYFLKWTGRFFYYTASYSCQWGASRLPLHKELSVNGRMCSIVLESRILIFDNLNVSLGLSWNILDIKATEILHKQKTWFMKKTCAITNRWRTARYCSWTAWLRQTSWLSFDDMKASAKARSFGWKACGERSSKNHGSEWCVSAKTTKTGTENLQIPWAKRCLAYPRIR